MSREADAITAMSIDLCNAIVESTKALNETIIHTSYSSAEVDQKGESANIVDGLFAIARAIEHVAKALENQDEMTWTADAPADQPRTAAGEFTTAELRAMVEREMGRVSE